MAAPVPVLTLNDGRKFPALGLGTLKSDETVEAIKYAIKEVGYRHIDCAHLYENEKEIGKALKSLFDEGIVKREELWVTSKLWNTYHERDLAIKALDITLKNLQLDYLDLYLIHWPQGFVYHGDNVLYPRDQNGKLIFSEVSPVDTWRTMIELQKSGKVKSIGVSNFSAEQIDELIKETGVTPAVNQVECHPYLAQKDLLEHHKKHNIVLTAYSPLGAPYKKLEDYPVLLKNPVVEAIANKHNRTPADVLIAFHLNRGQSVIPKSSNEKRMISNIKAASLKLTSDEVQILENLNKNLRYCRFKEFASFKYFPFNYNN